ncbi:hypothetical protein [Actinomadura rubrisoli]|uniref:Uncharacterized protein n=1 Tax=Actinomadura rubrisoli TaxID=2530368 RepID=A0A4R5CAV3_9ACTN|nr:hypothetical protein [Actinomadura rubrisoli]TDD95323.1 hypothetical protein E1298_05525 [Actinomadura rubrisoli]
MFNQWKRSRGDSESSFSQEELEQIEIFAAVVEVHLAAACVTPGLVHMITAGEQSATAHFGYLSRLGSGLEITVARLSRDSSDTDRAKAYQAEVVVGTLDDFTADVGRESELCISRNTAMIEGEPTTIASDLLSAYCSVVAT